MNVSLIAKKIDNKTLFNLLQSASHIKSVEGNKLTLVGVLIREEANNDGEIINASYAITEEGVYFGGAASFQNTLKELADLFGDEIVKNGLDVQFNIKVVGKNDLSIWKATIC